MSSTGGGYDLSASTYSPEGKLSQIDYAKVASQNSGTAIGIRCTDGVILAVEKILLSKMLVEGTNRRIFHIDRHLGAALSGLVSDGRQLVNRAREEAGSYDDNYGSPISPEMLANRLSQYVHYFTLSGALRPFGSAMMIAGYDKEEKTHSLHMVDPSGESWRYRGCAIGTGRNNAQTEIEKHKVFDMTCRDALKQVAKIIHVLHDEAKEKPFELEMSWICEETGWEHRLVPKDLREEVEAWAKKSIEEDEMADDDDDDE